MRSGTVSCRPWSCSRACAWSKDRRSSPPRSAGSPSPSSAPTSSASTPSAAASTTSAGRSPTTASASTGPGLNKGKRSIAIDLSRPEGRELATELITAPGENAGLFLSNFPESGWLADARLRARRPDLVYVNIVGNPDESTAVDYTVNAASGIANATGPVGSLFPVNNALPAWDIATGPQRGDRHPRRRAQAQHHRRGAAGEDLAGRRRVHDGRQPRLPRAGRGVAREPAAARQRHVRRVRPRLRHQRRPARDGRRHQPQPVAHAGEGHRHRGAPPRDGARVRRRLHQGGRSLPRPRRHRRAAQAVVRDPHARRGAHGARRARRVLGSVPDVHATARRRLARRAHEPGVRRRRAPRASACCARRRRR